MSKKHVRHILFDIDDTLYPKSSGVLQLIDARIEEYLRRRFTLGDTELREMRLGYWRRYGTTLRGLMIEDRVDPEDYLAYIHNVPLESLVRPNQRLDLLLDRVPAAKAVLTNSTSEHAMRVLRAVGVHRHFGPIFDIRTVGYVGKPDARAYQSALDALGAVAHECLFVDDSPANVRAASELGIHAVQIAGDGNAVEGDYVIHEIADLQDVLAVFGF